MFRNWITDELKMKKGERSEKAVSVDPDEILSKYDFSRAQPNKFASRYKKGTLAVTLDPEVARVFPTAEDVNKALRSLVRIIETHRSCRLQDE